jgi:hypothetical protein
MYRAPEQRGVPVIGVGLGPCGCQKVVARHATVILVEEPAEAVVSLDRVDLGCCATGEWPCCVSPATQLAMVPCSIGVAIVPSGQRRIAHWSLRSPDSAIGSAEDKGMGEDPLRVRP